MIDSSAHIPTAGAQSLKAGTLVRPAIVGLILLTLVTGGIFPAALFVSGALLWPRQASGSLLTRDGVVVGSRLIGQAFSRPEYFHPRASAAGTGYDATSSGATNLGPANPKLIAAVRQSARDYQSANGLGPDTPIPIDAVTTSASGLDPHISPPDAELQVARVASHRGLSETEVRRLVAQHTEGRDLGFIGAPRVSVLPLNLALDRASAPHGR